METNQLPNLAERFNQWLKESITIKLVSIGFLVLVLLIPSAWIQHLMEERQQRAESVIAEITSKWSHSQTLSGPVLVIPYTTGQARRTAFFLPETLDIIGKMLPEIRHRGIFDAVVHTAQLDITSRFNKPDFDKLDNGVESILWKEARLVVPITDLRGVSDNPVIRVGTKTIIAEPDQDIGMQIREFRNHISGEHTLFTSTGIVIPLNWQNEDDFDGQTQISFGIKGSDRLSFVPSGRTTNVNLSGPWGNPSFDGEFLPYSHRITDHEFESQWKVLHFNRPFSQQWKGEGVKLAGAEFGVKLLIPVDQYQKSIRTSKYGVLIILLTFISLFLVEITQKIRIHPFQYILIGAALIIYYTLLLSVSEQTGYNTAYWISTFATVLLISLYSMTFLISRKLTAIFTALLTIFYTFIFVIILQQDYSLLIGSIGLFVIVAALMYFSRKVKWYDDAST